MKNYLCLILLFISSNLLAQVWVNYPSPLIGYQTNDDLFKVSVTNSTGVVIDFIYKARILDENENILLESISGTISNKPGRINFDRSKFPDLLIRKEKIDVSKYTGTLTYISELLHPLDTISVIAREVKEVVLKNGLCVDEKGNPVIDPNKVSAFIRLDKANNFEIINKAFDTIFFNNQNPFDACLDLEISIKQSETIIYKAVAKSICAPPGKSKLSLTQKEKLKIEVNKYHLRDYTIPINPYVSIGNGDMGTEVSAQFHANWTNDYVTYKSNSTGLSFDFFEHATEVGMSAANNWLTTFDEQGNLSALETLGNLSFKTTPLASHNPYGAILNRSDILGNIVMFVLPADNFTEKQWGSYLNYMGQFGKGEIEKAKFEDFEIWTQKNLDNTWTGEELTGFDLNSFTFLLKDKKRVFFIQVFENLKVGKSDVMFSDTIDVKKVLNSIVYNNRKLNFQFSKANDLEKITFSAIGPPENREIRDSIFNRYLKYHCFLEQKDAYYNDEATKNHASLLKELDLRLKHADSSNDCSFFKIEKIVPGEPDFRKYKTYHWDSFDLKVSYRQQKEIDYRAPYVQQHNQKYVYNEDFKIVNHQIQFDQNYKTKVPDLKEGQQIIETERLTLRLEPEPSRRISIAKILNDQPDERILVSIIDKGSWNKGPQNPHNVQTIKVGKWSVIIPESYDSFNARGRYEAIFIIKSKEDTFVFAVNGKIKSDILDFMNSITIKGQQFHFEYDKEEKLKNISIK